MDHRQYLLNLFFKGDESFLRYVSARDEAEAARDVAEVKGALNFLLALALRGKDKLERYGYCYEPLSRGFEMLAEVRAGTGALRELDSRSLSPDAGAPGTVSLDTGRVHDFVVSLTRLERELRLPPPPPSTCVDLSRGARERRLLAILGNGNKLHEK
ncbi:ORF124 [Saltwater crocodilepox virus]|nr:IMV membrane protein [Saltwater crocodilepox virus]AVD69459.1 IMV membrane protein [Saltwater crocodilepox virus]QGT46562.1 ORF124 [Saltwater crocodilepox virus]QGT46778.1 ORF124 [Saltwater crocodilepox virus]QGT46994.1 ORF124 [Saltwater crocodilepox virus]